jgi:small GTP-binding protein
VSALGIYQLKICLLGNGGVGKTSLVYRYVENRFKENYTTTLGVNLLAKKVEIGPDTVKLQIWDFGGQEYYTNLRKKYITGAQGALLVCDVTSRESFEALDHWIADFRTEIADPRVPLILLGNKADLEERREVGTEELGNWASSHSVVLYETSAKAGLHVDESFVALAARGLELVK